MSRIVKPWWPKVLVTFLVTAFVGLVWFSAGRQPRDPIYRGKPLSVWLETYDPASPHGRGSRQWNEADDAVRHIGTNAIPLLFSWLRQSDSDLKTKLVELARKQSFIKVRPVPSRTRNFEASMAFIALGNTGKEAVPELMNIYGENPSKESQRAVVDTFSWVGPGADTAIPLLMEATTNSDKMVRANAVWALGDIHAQPELCVPVLIRALADSDEWTRVSAAHALGMFGTNAQSAIPLLSTLTNPSALSGSFSVMSLQVPTEARKALRKINPFPENRALPVDPLNSVPLVNQEPLPP